MFVFDRTLFKAMPHTKETEMARIQIKLCPNKAMRDVQPFLNGSLMMQKSR